MKKYIKPSVKVLNCKMEILAGSYINPKYLFHCGESCAIWHICRDRERDMPCKDYQYK